MREKIVTYDFDDAILVEIIEKDANENIQVTVSACNHGT